MPYRSAVLSDRQRDELLLFALDDGGLRGAKTSYPGSGDDSGATTFFIDAGAVDGVANKRVRLADAFGDQVDDRDMRDRLNRLAEALIEFDIWLQQRAIKSHVFEPSAYTAAMLWTSQGETIERWPWADIQPADFAEPRQFGLRLARLTPAQASQVFAVPGGDRVGTLWSSPGMVSDVYVRPVLPGDDVPGAFGLRPDTVAIAITDRLRVRSLPEVSEASTKLEPLLREGDALYVVRGPAYGSGYRWYEVHAPRAELSGWVAWAEKASAAWIEALPLPCRPGGTADPVLAEIGHPLWQLACFGDQTFTGERILSATSEDGLWCGDQWSYYLEPDWLNQPVSCQYEFGPSDPGEVPFDPISNGVLHPSLGDTARDLLDAAVNPFVGVIVEVTGQFDHPDSRDCTAVGDAPPSPIRAILECRSTFVIIEMQLAD